MSKVQFQGGSVSGEYREVPTYENGVPLSSHALCEAHHYTEQKTYWNDGVPKLRLVRMIRVELEIYVRIQVDGIFYFKFSELKTLIKSEAKTQYSD